MKLIINLLFACVALTICFSAHADKTIACVTKAYNDLQAEESTVWENVVNSMSAQNADFALDFQPQIDLMKIDNKMNLFSFNYFISKHSNRIMKSLFEEDLPLIALAPNWNVKINGEYGSVYKELINIEGFAKLFHQRELIHLKIMKIKNNKDFKQASHAFYKLLSQKILTEELEKKSHIKLREIKCG